MQECTNLAKPNWYGIYLLIILALLSFGCVTTNQGFLEKASALSSAGQWDKAVKVYQRAVSKHPTDPELRLLLTKAKWKASMEHMQKGEQLLDRGHYDEAISEFQLALAFYPANRKAARLIERSRNIQESLYQINKAQRLIRSGKYALAREALERAIELDPNNSKAKEALEELMKKAEKAPKYILRLKTKGPISLKFKKTPVSNVFEVLSRLTGINFIFDKDVQDSRVTLFMTDVSFDHFLDVLLKTSGLAAKVVDPTTVVVYPNVESKVREYQDLKIKTFYLDYLDVKKAVALLAKIVKARDIIANEKLHSVIVRGSEQQIEIASKLIEANDRPPAEILLNVEVLEVSRSKEKQLGIEFNPSSITFGIGEAAKTVSQDSTFADSASVYALDRLTNKEVLLSLPTATLNLLKQDTDTKTLANPQVRVKSGEKARIHIGERVPLRVNRRIDTTGVVTNDYQYQDIGIKLDSEPVINTQDEVTLKLNVEVSALGPNLGTVDEPQYSIKTRRATTILTVRDGEPVIIGGLISDEERRTVRKVPLLGDMPILGHLFTNLDTNKVKTDIIMTITPIVLRGQRVPGREVTEIWSGQERRFSMREPYESKARRQMTYLIRQDSSKIERLKRVPASAANTQPPVDFNSKRKDVTQTVTRKTTSLPNKEEKEFWPAMLGYTIHVGSYLQESRAKKRLDQLRRANYDVFMIPAHVPGKGVYYRLFLGRFKDLKSAQRVCRELKSKKDFSRDIHVVDKNWAFGG